MKRITIATLPEASAQEVFDWIVFNLLAQGQRSVGTVHSSRADILTCVYRSPEGYKCAGGWCIGDDEYNESMENVTWECLSTTGRVSGMHVDLIGHAQDIHDTSLPEEWAGKFAILALDYGLNTLVLDKPALAAV